jgi:hypothetical protein
VHRDGPPSPPRGRGWTDLIGTGEGVTLERFIRDWVCPLSEVRESVIEFRRVSFRAAMVDNRVILAGAIPAALLALLMDLLLGLLERKLTYAH